MSCASTRSTRSSVGSDRAVRDRVGEADWLAWTLETRGLPGRSRVANDTRCEAPRQGDQDDRPVHTGGFPRARTQASCRLAGHGGAVGGYLARRITESHKGRDADADLVVIG
jgi:hypothetical protein